VEEFRKLDSEMQAQTMLAFLYIANRSPVTVKDVGEFLGVTSASASRNVAVLGKWSRHNKPGHDLVYSYENPARRIEKFIELTPKGKRVAQTIEELLNVSKPER
jgi:DNA-binding MarR family transcriptional regulator